MLLHSSSIFSFFAIWKIKICFFIRVPFLYFYYLFYFKTCILLPLKNNPLVSFQIKNNNYDKYFYYYNLIITLNQLKSVFATMLYFQFTCSPISRKFSILRSSFIFKNSQEAFQVNKFIGFIIIYFKTLVTFLEIDFFLFFFETLISSQNIYQFFFIKQLYF